MALFRQPSKGLLTSLAVLSGLAAAAAWVQPADAQEPAACLSSNPADWPAPAKPYFLLIADTSGSMTNCTNPPTTDQIECPNENTKNSCGMVPTRLNDAKCALRNTVQAFGGEVNFGLTTYAGIMSNCPSGVGGVCIPFCGAANGGGCNPENYSCTISDFTNGGSRCGNDPNCTNGVGPGSPNFPENTWPNGGNVVVGIEKESSGISNTSDLLSWFDGLCNDNKELFADGATPIAGSLRTAAQYLRAGWNLNWSNSNYCAAGLAYTKTSPLDANDPACRSVNVILVTDGDETCDSQVAAEAAAEDLFTNGVTIGTKTWKVPVYVINFAGGSTGSTNAIAQKGGTTASYSANNETTLASALASIIGNAAKPEVCDNSDNNCNGCTDEGYTHYCNVPTAGACCSWNTTAQRTACGATACQCCNWTNATQRTTCLNQYTATITPANPTGNQALLPCTTPTQQTQTANWLCYNPGDVCDNADNNCASGIDENQTKCGTPLACPTTEVCNGKDDDCDGSIDEIGGCSTCVPSAEVCDGCDNDCDGIADDGVAPQACGLTTPANCAGTQACAPSQPVAQPGACVVSGGGLQACVNSPQTETCDGIDNNCNGIIDDNVPPTPCVPMGTPGGLQYNAPSQCRQGTQACGSMQCIGFIGPSTEVCDGIDNDCDGQVDEGIVGVGTACGTATPPCTPGTLQCVSGALVCQGGTQPQPENCDGIDNNCNGTIDDSPLSDAPPVGMTGCWTQTGNCCTFDNLTWCPPAGATCSGTGTLTMPCTQGSLVCTMGAWSCVGPVGPSAEVCDNLDNDCDGMTDDVTGVGQPCGTDQGECVAGIAQCSSNGVVCVGAVGPSAEVCDNKDNDCDGLIDDNIPGVGQPCGVNQAPCTLGTTACVAGAVVCQGGVQPTGEVCDGVDNDCDGSVDDAPLADAPAPNAAGCWTLPGNCCSYGSLQWCPPPGATCSGIGTLMPPCNRGTLACQGALGYVCTNSQGPSAEACDGVDNDCNGMIDDGTFPGEGNVCGSDEGQCVSGVIDCAGGILDCVGDVGPVQEICNGLDDDCDTTIDNGIVVGGPCTPTYDTTLYPGPRDKGACAPGIAQCDGMGGQSCLGGTGPQPEVCDGVDNDCDGSVDETGPAPDGIDGTANPLPPPAASIGDLCGVDTGACSQGNYACLNGQFVCLGGQGPQEESCDCNDNDCDGTSDEQDPAPASPLCAGTNQCVKSGSSCLCASPCMGGEFPCPPGQRCEMVTSSETGMTIGNFCVADNCGDCTKKTVLKPDNTILCAPAGTPAGANCVVPPVCQCKGLTGCQNPCAGVTCGMGEICTDYGPNAGTCVPNNCFAVPCQGCDQVCNNGSCVANPCKPDSCPGQTCVPNGDLMGFTCVDSCATKQCASGEICKDGVCVTDCPTCAAGEVCDYTKMPPACVTNLCTMPCANGGCCNPLTGVCGNCPCDGVVCPSGQVCQDGDCTLGQGGSGGAGGAGGAGGGETTVSSSSSSGTGGMAGAGGLPDRGVYGLPTGGGGCSCDLGAKERTNGFALALAALALGVFRKRTNGRRGVKEVSR